MQSKRLLLFLAVLLWTVFLAAGCKDKEGLATVENHASRDPVVPVSIIEVKPVPMRDVTLLPGTTEAWQDVQVAADTAGRVEWIGPREGEKVNKGDLLVKIDVSALKAALDHAEAQFKLANDLYQRRRRLFERARLFSPPIDSPRVDACDILASPMVPRARSCWQSSCPIPTLYPFEMSEVS